MRLYRRLLKWFPRAFRDRFGDEMASVFESHYRDARRQGRLALVAFWWRTVIDIVTQSAGTRRGVVGELVQDTRFGIRLIRRRPGISITAIITLALGVGVNVAAFSVVNAVLIRPLPFSSPERLVRIGEASPTDRALHAWNPGNYVDVQPLIGEAFASIGAFRTSPAATLTGSGLDPYKAATITARPEFFDVLGVAPARGRLFNDADLQPGAHSIIVSGPFWRSRLGADPNVVGREIELDGQRSTIVGVLMDGQEYPAHTDIWMALAFTPDDITARNSWNLQAIGRLKSGVSLEHANNVLARAMTTVTREHPGPMPRTAIAENLKGYLVGSVETNLLFAQAIALVILLIACANLANLMLTSVSGRLVELGVRASIGAGRGRLVRQLLAESLVLGVAGSSLGALFAAALVPVLVNAYPGQLPGRELAGIRWPELAVAMTAAIATTLLFGTVPALLASRAGASFRLHSSSRAGVSRRTGRLQRGLITLEVVMALTLVAGSFLLIRSFAGLVRQPIGFSSDRVVSAYLQLPAARFPTTASRERVFTDIRTTLAGLPGVDAVATVFPAPFDLASMGSAFRWDPALGIAEPLRSERRYASAGYLETLSIPLERGRFFTAADTADAPLVAVVNHALAAKYGDVVGKRFLVGDRDVATIVGVIADIRMNYVRPEEPAVILSYDQGGLIMGSFLLKTDRNARDVDAAFRRVLRDAAPGILAGGVQPLDDVIGASVSDRRFNMALLTALASLALALSVVGIYGVMAHAAAERRREMAIRIAMGAAPAAIRSLSLRQGLAPVGLGVAGGLVGAWFLTALLKKELFQVGPHDPWTLAAASAAFIGAGLIACWIPARRSTRVDPASVLRAE